MAEAELLLILTELWMRLSARSKVVDAGGWTPTAVGVIEAHG
jgi:hypothetical protein